MIRILAEFGTEDYSKFINIFSTEGLKRRMMHGSRSSQVFRKDENPEHIFILFEWESKEAFSGFLNDENVQEIMKNAGTLSPPTFTFLEKAAEFEG